MNAARPIVVITRDEVAGGPLWQALARRGAAPFPLPATAIGAPGDFAPLDAALRDLAAFRVVAFTSRRAVAAACGRGFGTLLGECHVRPLVAAAGPATAAALRADGIAADVTVTAEDAGAAGLAAALEDVGGGRVLWPRSQRAAPELKTLLEALGFTVCDPVAYTTSAAEPAQAGRFRALLDSGEIAAVTFLAPSAAFSLASAFADASLRVLAKKTVVASVGPTTSAALASLGAPADVEPRCRTVDGLAEAVMACIGARKARLH
jgi:uroporphyrinogen-III synthase